MPPRAMAPRVFSVISMASGVPCLSRNSSTIDGGNFGAPPKPPRTGSKVRARSRTAVSVVSAVGRSPPGSAEPWPSASTTLDPWESTASRSSVQACDTPARSRWNCCRGKYVPV